MAEPNILSKSMRSVFVGNIPFETPEEKLKDIFDVVGPVISFKLVYDRETGKHMGYGFCEYNDQETALSAMRKLNGYEIGGRILQVNNACTEKSRQEIQSLMTIMATSEYIYGDAVNPEKAPEVISNVVSSLPPEQMYELMKQMKECIQNNTREARNILLQNPQLSYALLQALVMIKILDPEVAKTMLYATNKVPPSLCDSSIPNAGTTSKVQPALQTSKNDNIDRQHNNMYHRQSISQDLSKSPPNQMPLVPPPPALSIIEPLQSFMGVRDNPQTSAMDSDNGSFGDMCRDGKPNNLPSPIIVQQPIVPSKIIQSSQPQAQQASNQTVKTSDSEKAALIKQVLQITDAQIAKLPLELGQKIHQLKENILSCRKKD